MDPSQVQKLAREWADDMIEDLVLGLVMETHKTAKLSLLVCSHCGTQCRQFNTPLYTDIFRNDADSVKSNDRVRCPQCNKPYGATHLARHLEKCMQLKGARRAGVKSYAEEDSSPEKDKSAAATADNPKKRKKPVNKVKSNTAPAGLISDTISLDSVGSGVSTAVGDTSAGDGGADGPTAKAKKPPVKRRKKNADGAEGASDTAAPAKGKKSKTKATKVSAATASTSASASGSTTASASGSASVSTSNSPATLEDASGVPSSDVAGIDEDTFLDVELEDLSDF
ncbi:hypothetical protein BCR44DRAFT_1440488 [Catenaria anguillulae PL171]|uniref:SAGA-associated factor 11 n=1 Tax=Catenaria anguillulae PL171 TaxID=765915 RepID=A0A1Y2HCI8_9FUNG|nr:hypothetical protein BCR44DRAFT_1440488 [Catenaria anguillulae PL171]